MLQAISTLTQEQRIDALIARPKWVAVCEDTGAYLLISHGRAKFGNGTRYTLILPKEKGEGLFSRGSSDFDRSQFRAWDDNEAIEIANQRLAKMLAKREKCNSN